MAVWRVTIKGKLFGQNVQNVLHFKEKNPGVKTMLQFANDIAGSWLGQIRFLCRVAMVWQEINIIDIEHPDQNFLVFPINTAGFIGGSNDVAPFLTLVFKIKTATGGKRGRGRFHVSGAECAGLTEGVWGTNFMINFNSVCNSIKGNYLGANPGTGFNLGVMPRTNNAADFKPATDLVPRNYPGTQRRRNFFYGS